MASRPRFKLLFLPSLTYEAIVQKMNVREQYKFARLSKRMQRVVWESNRVGVVVCCVNFDLNEMGFDITHERTRSKYSYRVRVPDEYISLAKDQILFLKNSMRLQAVDLCFLEDHPVRIERDIVPFLKQENLKIRDIFSFLNEEPNDELYENLLDAGKNSRKLKFKMACSPDFCPSQCLSVDWFSASHGGWVTVDQLITNFMDCKEIYLDRCQMTPRQLNPFVKKWMEGSRIEHFDCDMTDDSQFASIVDGIEATEIRQAHIWSDHKSFGPNKSFLIKQISGVQALVFVGSQRVFLKTKFSLDAPLPRSPDNKFDYSYDDDEFFVHSKHGDMYDEASDIDNHEEADDEDEDDDEESEVDNEDDSDQYDEEDSEAGDETSDGEDEDNDSNE